MGAGPVRPLVPATPSPLNVPADTIATSGGAGQVDKVAAVGIEKARWLAPVDPPRDYDSPLPADLAGALDLARSDQRP